jgi:hypothetical protein
MFAVLLRASSEQKVWRIVQGATLGVDFALLATLYALLAQQGRLDIKLWSGMDWLYAVFPTSVTLIRIAYFLEIGGEPEGGKEKAQFTSKRL